MLRAETPRNGGSKNDIAKEFSLLSQSDLGFNGGSLSGVNEMRPCLWPLNSSQCKPGMSGSIPILNTYALHRDIFDLISGLVLCSLQRGRGERQTFFGRYGDERKYQFTCWDFGVQLDVGGITAIYSKEDFMDLRFSFVQSNTINQLSPI